MIAQGRCQNLIPDGVDPSTGTWLWLSQNRGGSQIWEVVMSCQDFLEGRTIFCCGFKTILPSPNIKSLLCTRHCMCETLLLSVSSGRWENKGSESPTVWGHAIGKYLNLRLKLRSVRPQSRYGGKEFEFYPGNINQWNDGKLRSHYPMVWSEVTLDNKADGRKLQDQWRHFTFIQGRNEGSD